MRCIVRFFVQIALVAAFASSVHADELTYRLQSPLLGGSNAALYQVETARVGMVNQQKAKLESDRQAAEQRAQQAINNAPGTRFANALQSQLFMSISQQLSHKMSSLPVGQSGSFQSGDVLVAYSNEGPVVKVTITTPQGASTLELPTGSI